jgi:hypothetical protein
VALRRKRDRERRRVAAPAPPAADLLDGLIRQTQRLDERVARLEERVEASEKASLSQADSNDVIELRLHSARLAAELSRVTVELRAEIDELARARNHDRAPRVYERAGDAPRDLARPSLPTDQTGVIDLSERRARQSTGWQPIADD